MNPGLRHVISQAVIELFADLSESVNDYFPVMLAKPKLAACPKVSRAGDRLKRLVIKA
jgi:hypothetical protein